MDTPTGISPPPYSRPWLRSACQSSGPLGRRAFLQNSGYLSNSEGRENNPNANPGEAVANLSLFCTDVKLPIYEVSIIVNHSDNISDVKLPLFKLD